MSATPRPGMESLLDRVAARAARPARAGPDLPLTLATLALLLIGLFFVYSSSSPLSARLGHGELGLVWRQLGGAALGLFLMGLIVRYGTTRAVERLSVAAVPLLLVLLIAVLIPGIGYTVNGARRWIALGPLGQIEAASWASLLFFLAMARAMASKGWTLGLTALLAGFLLLSSLQPNIGGCIQLLCAIVICGLVVPERFGRRRRLRLLGLLVITGLGAVLLMVAAPYRTARLSSFLNPWQDAFGSGFQLTQSLLAIGGGDTFGVGLTRSVAKQLYLPEAHTDFIFAIVAEEAGAVGATFVLCLALYVGYRCLLIGSRASTRGAAYSAVLCAAVGGWILAAAIVHVAVSSGLVPTTSMTFPLVSYGRGAVVLTLVMLGCVLMISREAGVGGPQAAGARRLWVPASLVFIAAALSARVFYVATLPGIDRDYLERFVRTRSHERAALLDRHGTPIARTSLEPELSVSINRTALDQWPPDTQMLSLIAATVNLPLPTVQALLEKHPTSKVVRVGKASVSSEPLLRRFAWIDLTRSEKRTLNGPPSMTPLIGHLDETGDTGSSGLEELFEPSLSGGSYRVVLSRLGEQIRVLEGKPPPSPLRLTIDLRVQGILDRSLAEVGSRAQQGMVFVIDIQSGDMLGAAFFGATPPLSFVTAPRSAGRLRLGSHGVRVGPSLLHPLLAAEALQVGIWRTPRDTELPAMTAELRNAFRHAVGVKPEVTPLDQDYLAIADRAHGASDGRVPACDALPSIEPLGLLEGYLVLASGGEARPVRLGLAGERASNRVLPRNSTRELLRTAARAAPQPALSGNAARDPPLVLSMANACTSQRPGALVPTIAVTSGRLPPLLILVAVDGSAQEVTVDILSSLLPSLRTLLETSSGSTLPRAAEAEPSSAPAMKSDGKP